MGQGYGGAGGYQQQQYGQGYGQYPTEPYGGGGQAGGSDQGGGAYRLTLPARR